MSDQTFFEDPTEQSKIKSLIVSKYFWPWAKITSQHSDKIAYIDLFSGPGIYQDGTKSTPLLIIQKALEEPKIRDSLVIILNDQERQNTESLKREIKKIPNIEELSYSPQINNFEVGKEIAEHLNSQALVPTLSFIDPWGYKGLSLNLINSVLKDWGCDCIFFFNYNRINMGVSNPVITKRMEEIFGVENLAKLREKIKPLDPEEREMTIIESLCESLNHESEERYILPFRFINEKRMRTSHHLIFVSKHPRGYQIMKDIMAKESSTKEQGIASFEYNPQIHLHLPAENLHLRVRLK